MSRLKALLPEGVTATILAVAVLVTSNCSNSWNSLGFSICHPLSRQHSRQSGRMAGNAPSAADRGSARADKEHGNYATAKSAAAPPKGQGGRMREGGGGHEGGLAFGRRDRALSAPQIIKGYSKRWTIERGFFKFYSRESAVL